MKEFKQILVVKETRQDEKRVALTPQTVAQLTSKGYRILVEKAAGLNAGFGDAQYLAAGAKIVELSAQGFPSDSFIVRVLRPSYEREQLEKQLYRDNTAMLGFLFPFVADDHIDAWRNAGLTTLSFDLLKVPSKDPRNAQAAMSRIAGRLALQHALKVYQGSTPRLTVIGPGAAGMNAVFEALRQNIPVQVFGRKERQRAELQLTGIKYFVLPDAPEDQLNFIRAYLSNQTLVITAAREPGKKAPLLLDAESLSILPPNAVIVDLAISNGGNVSGSKHDATIALDNGKFLVNISGYPKTEPATASEAYANCVVNLITEILSPQGHFNFKASVVQDMWLTHEGELHKALYADFDEPAPAAQMLRT